MRVMGKVCIKFELNLTKIRWNTQTYSDTLYHELMTLAFDLLTNCNLYTQCFYDKKLSCHIQTT